VTALQLIFSCENDGCFYGTNHLRNFRIHFNSCVPDTVITCAQKVYSQPVDVRKKALVSEGIIPSLEWENIYFATIDIETGMSRDNEKSIFNLLMVHKLLSIGITANFG
jgi:hypothetical protein